MRFRFSMKGCGTRGWGEVGKGQVTGTEGKGRTADGDFLPGEDIIKGGERVGEDRGVEAG